MKPRIFIDGDQGTTGLQIHARLAGRTDLDIVTLAADRRKDPRARAEAINDCDVALLCLPDEAARQAVAAIANPAVRVIDASSAHRTDPRWVYGFPEMSPGQPARIASAARVSNPGCYPTGAIALLRPLIEAGLLPADYPLAVHAVSGYSGRGRAGVEQYEGGRARAGAGGRAVGSDREGSGDRPAFQVYGLGLDHKHVPEIALHAGLAAPPVFVPAYGSFRQGIVLTVALHLRLLPRKADTSRIHDCLRRRYAGAPNVQVTPLTQSMSHEPLMPPAQVTPQSQAAATQYLDPEALNGSDKLQLSVFGNERQGQVLLSAVFDNLGKGAAGAAVQNLDLMLPQIRRAPA